mmetsp:Transcript_19165/g.30034  ORF Transcript_19165/g.30034 Transcript_19165/m.30034 type:complete len:111 (-) Transcript_19165:425-757(-)
MVDHKSILFLVLLLAIEAMPHCTLLGQKMSIEKVDWTSEKKLCDGFEIKGATLPHTMKYYRNGEFQDYPLGRDKDSIMRVHRWTFHIHRDTHIRQLKITLVPSNSAFGEK